MSNPNSIRCEQCNLLNFAQAPFCKRCKNSLKANQGNVININVNLPNPVQELNINSNGATFNASLNDNSFAPPVENDQTALLDEGYQPQNQTGFEQWKQMEQAQNQIPQQNYPPYQTQPTHQNYPYQNMPYHPNTAYQNVPYQMMLPSIWRRGDELVVHKTASMPDTCVKCNEFIADGGYSMQKYRWHNPLIYIALISPLIYIILATVLSQRGSINVPLCQRHTKDKENTGKSLAFGGVAALVIVFFSFALGSPGFAFFIIFLALIGLVSGYEYLYKPLRVTKVENDYLYLKGVSNEYLNQFTHM